MNNAFGFIESPSRAASVTSNASGPGSIVQEPNPVAVVRHSRHPWAIPASPQYLRAVREADLAVRRAVLRWVVLRHSSRVLKP